MTDSKTILVTGASGLVGRPLCQLLKASDHSVRTLSRGQGGDFQWDPASGEIDPVALKGVNAVIHLAGETVAQRWSDAAKKRILESRVKGAELLVREILKQDSNTHYISASGINYYGYSRNEALDESADTGEGFLAEVCRQWEQAAQPLMEAGHPCAFVRTGVVLDASGGALSKMLPPFKAGVGGRIGNGEQMMSWIILEDLVRIYAEMVEERMDGPINAVVPEALSNEAFTKSLGKALHRPTIFPLPKAVVSMLFGEMGQETVLSDLNIVPGRLKEMNFTWKYSAIDAALKQCLK